MGKKLSTKLYQFTEGHIAFLCPGCKSVHNIPVDGSRGWSLSGDYETPTIRPSLDTRSGHYCQHHQVKKLKDPSTRCWCDMPKETRDFECFICHLFVTAGKIQFLDDSTHELRGMIVPIPDWKD